MDLHFVVAAIAATIIATVLLLRRTTVSVIIRKDPSMDPIKQRLGALEAANAALKAQLETVITQLAEHQTALTSVSSADVVATLSSRVDTIEADIGTDAEPAADAQSVPQLEPLPLPLSSAATVTG